VSLGEREGVGVWKCQRDDSHCGSAVDFLALARGIETMAALAELERLAGIDARAPQRPPQRRPAPPPTHPPTAEVAALWGRCLPLGIVPDVADAWAARGINVAMAEDRDLARALPLGVAVPSWAFCAGKRWSAGAHRLVVPMFDAAGRVASLHARAAVAPEGKPKGLSPAGFAIAGLVMADPLARLLLSGAPCGDGEPSAVTVKRVGLLVAEGVPDFLTWATHWGDAAENAPAVLSVISGSWSDTLAARVPSGTTVTIATHNDAGGDKYASQIASTLARCDVRRFSFQEASP
jgi:hypothetical protein